MRFDRKQLLGVGASIASAVFALMFMSNPVAAEGPGPGSGEDATGIVVQAPLDFRFGEWHIGSHVYHAVTGTTTFSEEFGPFDLNKCVRVRYTKQETETVRLAQRIVSVPALACVNEGGEDGEHRDDHGLVETRGELQRFPVDLVGDWQVGGITYTAGATTTFRQEDGPFTVGRCVEVKHAISSTLALQIKTEDGRACGEGEDGHVIAVGKARGLLNDFPSTLTGTWTISDTAYEVVSRTMLARSHGDFFVGGCVEVYFVLSDTNRTALKIATEGLDDCTARPEDHIVTPTLQARGIVSSTPPTTTLYGTYVISGVEYLAITGTTRFDQEHGRIRVGDCAQVKYFVQGDLKIAVRIASGETHECGRFNATHVLFGEVTSLPGTTNQIGTWGIGDREIVVTTTTLQIGAPFTVGLTVKVEFVVRPDGTLVAKKIEAKRPTQERRFEGKAYGILQSRPISPEIAGTWTVASVTYEVSTTTRLTGSLEVGNCVEVHYRINSLGQRIARKIKGESADECMGLVGEVLSKTYGFVSTMPVSGFVGSWVIGGVTYEGRVSSRFEQERGALAEGSFVEVHFMVVDGVNVIVELETHVPPSAGEIDDTGVVSGTTTRGPQVAGSTLVINGTTYTIIGATLVNDSLGNIANGAKVAINAYTDATTGQRVVTQITALGAVSVFMPVASR